MPEPRNYPGVHKRHALTCAQRGDDATTCACPWSFTAELRIRGQRVRTAASGFGSKTEARKEREKALRRLAEEPQVNRRGTVAEAAELWLTAREQGVDAEPLRPTTLVGYRRHLRNYLVPFAGTMKIADVRSADLKAFVLWLRSERPDMGLTTQSRVYATVRVFLRDQFDEGLIGVDPTVRRQQRRRHARTSDAKPKTLEPEQFARLLTWLYGRGERLAPVIAFAGFTGLRRGEVAGLTWLDVNLDRAVLTVRQQLLEVDGGLVLSEPKTNAGTGRKVDLDGVVLAVLRDVQQRQQRDRAEWGSDYADAGVVFAREDGRVLSPMTLTKAFPRLVRAYNREQTDPSLRLPVLTFHSLRHHAASAALAGGTDLAVVSKRLGHASIAVTSNFYSHLVGGLGMRAAEATSAAVGWQFPTGAPHLPHIAGVEGGSAGVADGASAATSA